MDGRRLKPADAGILAGLLSLPLLLFAEALTGARVFYERDIHTFWLPKVEVTTFVLISS
jgi:hypothetical protein